MRSLFIFFLLSVFTSCNVYKRYSVQIPFSESPVPPIPDYNKSISWAALPSTIDVADEMPDNSLKYGQDSASVDVFFVHPTIFTDEPKGKYKWNADVNDGAMNRKTDGSAIKYQASVFNVACRIYAPRYRQAHISAFYTSNLNDKRNSLDTAYSDVKKSFEYYLAHYNNGRPIIIASHSQGTIHALRLLQDCFDNKPLQKQLVCAYLVGMPIAKDSFCCIAPCQGATETTCWISWNTFAYNYYPTYYKYGMNNAVCTNPLSWKTDSIYCDYSLNSGGLLKKFNKIFPSICDARVQGGMLWINQPDFLGANILNWKIYHVIDYGLFYMNIRKNVEDRCTAYLKGKK